MKLWIKKQYLSDNFFGIRICVASFKMFGKISSKKHFENTSNFLWYLFIWMVQKVWASYLIWHYSISSDTKDFIQIVKVGKIKKTF